MTLNVEHKREAQKHNDFFATRPKYVGKYDNALNAKRTRSYVANSSSALLSSLERPWGKALLVMICRLIKHYKLHYLKVIIEYRTNTITQCFLAK